MKEGREVNELQTSLFDYAGLDTETRIVVKQRTEEIKVLVRRSAQDIIDIGNKLIEVKARLGHGNFGGWLDAEFGWSDQTARRFMHVAGFAKINTSVDFANMQAKALYLLAAPSTPEPARIEAIERSTNGETITHKAAQEIVNGHKMPATPPNATRITLQPAPASTFVAPRPNGEIVRTEVRFVPAAPFIDDDIDDAIDDAEADGDGYDWTDDDLDIVNEPVYVVPPVKSPEWTPSQLDRKERVESGFAVHANMKSDLALIEWAKQEGCFARVDRATEWGNPFHLPDDGDRETIIENYRWYMQKKPSLLAKVRTLKGKVLGCWCYPETCHAGHLEDLANGSN